MKMCEQILKKKTAPQYNSNSLNCKKNRSAIIAGWENEAAINKVEFEQTNKNIATEINELLNGQIQTTKFDKA